MQMLLICYAHLLAAALLEIKAVHAIRVAYGSLTFDIASCIGLSAGSFPLPVDDILNASGHVKYRFYRSIEAAKY